jgi:hypothetical protein
MNGGPRGNSPRTSVAKETVVVGTSLAVYILVRKCGAHPFTMCEIVGQVTPPTDRPHSQPSLLYCPDKMRGQLPTLPYMSANPGGRTSDGGYTSTMSHEDGFVLPTAGAQDVVLVVGQSMRSVMVS